MKKSSDSSPVRFARYIRTTSLADTAKGPGRQLAAIDRFIKRHSGDWIQVAHYSDDGVSPFNPQTGLLMMLIDIQSGRINVDCVLVESRSRIAHKRILARTVEPLLNSLGVRIVAADKDLEN